MAESDIRDDGVQGRRAAEADAAGREAEARGEVDLAIGSWLAALNAYRVVPDSLKVQTQPQLFAASEAQLYEERIKGSRTADADLPLLIAHFRHGHLAASYDHEAICAQFAQLLDRDDLGPAVRCLWDEWLTASPRACDLALRLRPDDPHVAGQKAQHLAEAGRLEDARQMLVGLMQARCGDADALKLLRRLEEELLGDDEYLRRRVELADGLVNAGQYDLALAELRAGTQRCGEQATTAVRTAWCLLELDRPEEARNAAQLAADLNAQSAESHVALGSALRKLGQLREAAAQLDVAAELAGADDPMGLQAREIASQAYSQLGEQAYLAGELPGASRFFEAALERSESNRPAVQRMAQLAELSHDYASAAYLWERFEEQGRDAFAWRSKVCALLADGSDNALLGAAELCAASGGIQWADEILRQVDNERLREEHELFEAIPAAASEIDALCGRGWESLGSGDHARARGIFEKAKPLCPNDQRILRGLGFALLAEVDTAFGDARRELLLHATNMLNQAIAVNPTTDDAREARRRLSLLSAGGR